MVSSVWKKEAPPPPPPKEMKFDINDERFQIFLTLVVLLITAILCYQKLRPVSLSLKMNSLITILIAIFGIVQSFLIELPLTQTCDMECTFGSVLTVYYSLSTGILASALGRKCTDCGPMKCSSGHLTVPIAFLMSHFLADNAMDVVYLRVSLALSALTIAVAGLLYCNIGKVYIGAVLLSLTSIPVDPTAKYDLHVAKIILFHYLALHVGIVLYVNVYCAMFEKRIEIRKKTS